MFPLPGLAADAGAWYQDAAHDLSRLGLYGTPVPGVSLHQLEDAIDGVIAEVIEKGIAPEESADLTEVEEAFVVREALAGLSTTCQDMLDRFFARDQSYKTIADELDIPSGTIASRIARCLGRLKQALEPESS